MKQPLSVNSVNPASRIDDMSQSRTHSSRLDATMDKVIHQKIDVTDDLEKIAGFKTGLKYQDGGSLSVDDIVTGQNNL